MIAEKNLQPQFIISRLKCFPEGPISTTIEEGKNHMHIKRLFAFDNLHFLITKRKNKKGIVPTTFYAYKSIATNYKLY